VHLLVESIVGTLKNIAHPLAPFTPPQGNMNAPFLKESKNALLIPAKMPAQNPDKEGVRVQGTGFRG
jgi:hypothetical protein